MVQLFVRLGFISITHKLKGEKPLTCFLLLEGVCRKGLHINVRVHIYTRLCSFLKKQAQFTKDYTFCGNPSRILHRCRLYRVFYLSHRACTADNPFLLSRRTAYMQSPCQFDLVVLPYNCCHYNSTISCLDYMHSTHSVLLLRCQNDMPMHIIYISKKMDLCLLITCVDENLEDQISVQKRRICFFLSHCNLTWIHMCILH
ncbi:hypothetical protein X975_10021, partial [Stegodyphus mimosarum]